MSTNTEIKLYNQYIEALDTKSDFEWGHFYSNHMQIFNDVFSNKNYICNPNDEQYGVWIEICALFEYWENNSIIESIKMWENLIEMHDDGVCTNINVGRVLYVLGTHYYIEDKYEKALDYWLLAFGNKIVEGMYQMAEYYCDIVKNYPKAVECWVLASENGCHKSMNSLGYYYFNIVKDYKKAVEYYMKAVDYGNVASMGNLAHYYKTIEKNNGLAMKYYVMKISFGDYTRVNPMLNLMTLFDVSNDDFDMLYTLVEKIVTVEELNCYYHKVIIRNKFLQWKVLYKVERDYEAQTQTRVRKQFVDIRKSLETNNFDILHFKNKFLRAMYFNTKDKCALCHDENVLNIDIECFHGVCYKCYIPNLKCFSRCVAQYRK